MTERRWTEPQIAYAAKLWSEGATQAEIARAIAKKWSRSVSANSVASVMFRNRKLFSPRLMRREADTLSSVEVEVVSAGPNARDPAALCPCCGHAWFGFDPSAFAVRIELSPMQIRIVDAIARGGGRPVPIRQVVDRVYADRHDGGPLLAEDSVRTQIFYLRQKLAGSGFTISHASGGYYIGQGAPTDVKAVAA